VANYSLIYSARVRTAAGMPYIYSRNFILRVLNIRRGGQNMWRFCS